MAAWPEIPEWIDPMNINGGNIFKAADGITFEDLNTLIQNLMYLKEFGGGVVPTTGTFTENGIYIAGGDGLELFEKVIVNVQPPLQQKSVTPTTSEQRVVADEGNYGLSLVIIAPIQTEEVVAEENGVITPPAGKYFSKVTIKVPQEVVTALLISKTIERIGTYNATDDGADGYSSVTVAIPTAEGVSF